MSSHKNFLEVLVQGQSPKIDIVAVHGLNPKNKADHAKETWTSGKILWLRDFLSPKRPDARILLFGYNSDVRSSNNTMHIDDHARNLLNQLERKRKDDPQRPLIFIAHSLGGLVVKQALVEAKINQRYELIRLATYGIVFFATPHRGGNYAKLGTILSDIANASMRNPPSKLVEALQQGSDFLERLDSYFRHQLEDYYYLSFYETRFYSPLKIIVDEKSAQLGQDSNREQIFPIDRDHNQICKFSQEDGDYEQVEGEVLQLIDRAITSAIDRGLMNTPDQNSRNPGSAFLNSPFLPWGRPSPASSPALNPSWLSSSPGLGKYDTQDDARIFEVPENRNRNFIGRQDILHRLVHTLTSNTLHHRIALYGLGGVGKSDIARQCAYTIRDSHTGISVFWIQANSFDHTHQSIMKIARALQIEGRDAPDADVFELVRHNLEKPERGRWVMIIDHADDSQSLTLPQGGKKLHKRIPDCSHGSVLLTTRNKKVATLFADELEEVPPLFPKESEELMQQLLKTKHYQEGGLDELTRLLNHFPLALVQAASFIDGNDMTVETYLQRYHENKNDALEVFGHSHEWDDSEPVTTTWMISFKQLQANNQYAADLLSTMAFLDSSDIPEALIRGVDPTKTPLQFEEACGELKAFSFITETSIRSTTSANADSTSLSKWFNIQLIVQLVMQQWLRKHGQATKWSDAALVAVSKALPSTEMSHEQWKTYETYLPHVQTVLNHVDDSTQEPKCRADLLHNVSWYFRIRGYHDTAAAMACDAIAIRERILGEEDEDTLASIRSLCRILFEQGKLEESEQRLMPAIEICKRKFGEKHKDTLQNQGHLAAIRGMQGRYEEAFELQSEILKESCEGPEAWIAMRDLAITLIYMNRRAEAESLQRMVYRKRLENLGEDHPETQVIMSDLATTCIEQGNFSEAEELLISVLRHSRRILGERHPHTMAAYESLKDVLQSQGNTEHVKRLEDALRRVQRDWKQKEKNARQRQRPDFKRRISSSVITYSYRRPSAPTEDVDANGKSRRESEGGIRGLGLTFSRSTTMTTMSMSEDGDDYRDGFEDDDDDEENDDEREETVKKGLAMALIKILGMPLNNIQFVNRAEDPMTPFTPIDGRKQSLSTPKISIDDVASVAHGGEVSTRARSATDATSVMTLSDKPKYSNNVAIRSIQKKTERTFNQENVEKTLVASNEAYVKTVQQGAEWYEKWKKTKFRKSIAAVGKKALNKEDRHGDDKGDDGENAEERPEDKGNGEDNSEDIPDEGKGEIVAMARR